MSSLLNLHAGDKVLGTGDKGGVRHAPSGHICKESIDPLPAWASSVYYA